MHNYHITIAQTRYFDGSLYVYTPHDIQHLNSMINRDPDLVEAQASFKFKISYDFPFSLDDPNILILQPFRSFRGTVNYLKSLFSRHPEIPNLDRRYLRYD